MDVGKPLFIVEPDLEYPSKLWTRRKADHFPMTILEPYAAVDNTITDGEVSAKSPLYAMNQLIVVRRHDLLLLDQDEVGDRNS